MQAVNNEGSNGGKKKKKKKGAKSANGANGSGKKKKKRKKGRKQRALTTYTSSRVDVARRNLGGWTAAGITAAALAGGVGAFYFGRDLISNNYVRNLLMVGAGAPLLFVKNRAVASAGAAIAAVALVTSSLTFFNNYWPEDSGEKEEKEA